MVFTITGNSDMSLQEVNDVAGVISSIVADDANIIFGTSVDESFADEICVTVVATSFEVPDVASANQRRAVAPPVPEHVGGAALEPLGRRRRVCRIIKRTPAAQVLPVRDVVARRAARS